MRKSSTFLLIPLTGLALVVAGAQTTPTSGTHSSTATHKSSTGSSAAHAGTKPTGKVTTLTTDKQKQSYAIGMSFGRSLKRDSLDLDLDILMQGLKDTLAGNKMLLTDQEAQATLSALQGQIMAQQKAKMEQAAVKNKQEGEAFLAANKTKDGVVALPSGLQYKILKQGTGPKPTANDTVVCNYRGTLINGTEFDSSEKHGGPATFPVKGVIKGWTEALQLMPVGSKWELFVPADLAYGERAPGGEIGPNATLIFDVELLSIQPAKASTTN
ncbi:MAG TPA: FKBP-type peptidyl-prolyl cis-trans isomerase [Terriglobales bacterium]|nr:FKBP-type peptidyl-prolyl cis-trans isomerase [Terriglobales bacterium]